MKKDNLKVFKIVIFISLLISLSMVIVYLVESLNQKKSYFSEHFAIPITLFSTGIIALMLPKVTTKSYSGESRGDSMIIVVGFLLLACAFVSLLMSYVNLGI